MSLVDILMTLGPPTCRRDGLLEFGVPGIRKQMIIFAQIRTPRRNEIGFV